MMHKSYISKIEHLSQFFLCFFLCLFTLFFWLNILPQSGHGNSSLTPECFRFLCSSRLFFCWKQDSQSSHLKVFFSAIWSCFNHTCSFKFFLYLKDKSHMLHWNSSSSSKFPCVALDILWPCTFRTWILISLFFLNFFSQIVQKCFLSSECTYLIWYVWYVFMVHDINS